MALHVYPASGESEKKENNKDLLNIVIKNWEDILQNEGVATNPDDWMSFFKKILESNSKKKT